MIPIHIVTQVIKAHRSQVAAGASSQRAGSYGSSYGNKGFSDLARSTECGTTAGRLVAAIVLSLLLCAVIIGATWGGTGFRLVKEEASVRPGINAEWMSPNVAPLVTQLESSDREIYRERAELAALVGLKDGVEVADVGAGSGFMAEEFSRLVGPRGRVYAVDINPAMVEYIRARAASRGLINVRAHLGRPDRLNLTSREGGVLDVVFMADTYHHFEYPQSMLRSMRRLLRKNGEIVIVDMNRIPGQSPAWVLDHVRTDKAHVIRELTEAGFELVNEPAAPFLKENYVLRFRRN